MLCAKKHLTKFLKCVISFAVVFGKFDKVVTSGGGGQDAHGGYYPIYIVGVYFTKLLYVYQLYKNPLVVYQK